jgi:hypothetical protein
MILPRPRKEGYLRFSINNNNNNNNNSHRCPIDAIGSVNGIRCRHPLTSISSTSPQHRNRNRDNSLLLLLSHNRNKINTIPTRDWTEADKANRTIRRGGK